ncbi:hypothetical protein ACU18_14630 [Arthrobacter sp. ZBG10]|uniref:hypothetical protein n=1 Tax=Arthrobacter sp. ZBG10 TaxID=1676590 RepID=UPI000682CD64|nr:hypothetical protein [Arthrobacter sp. ZBG10]KNH16088.1 hypothetical protein ACU18_14630 [Arthrobacter sp. ZBG10]
MTAVPQPATDTPPAAALTPLPPAPPSIHARAVMTWLAIFPLVSIGMLALGPLMDSWHPVLRAMGLTLLVVPCAVYVVLPRLFRLHGAMASRRAAR